MDPVKLLTDGFSALNEMTQGDIEERIEYLEKLTRAYKSILEIKKLLNAKPPRLGLDFPANGKPVKLHPLYGTIRKGSLIDKIYNHLSLAPGGVTIEMLVKLTNSVDWTYVVTSLKRRNDLFEEITTGVWRLKPNALHDSNVARNEVGNTSLQS